jgi:hypothetical protein
MKRTNFRHWTRGTESAALVREHHSLKVRLVGRTGARGGSPCNAALEK